MITQDYVRERFDYDSETGVLTWLPIKETRPHDIQWNKRFSGKVAGGPDTYGHLQVRLDGPLVLVHRIIWLWMTGEFPKEHIDHINGIAVDNRWSNLRECTHAENHQNRKQQKSVSGYRGVYWHKGTQKWQAQIRVNNKLFSLGYFNDPRDASKAYLAAKAKYHTFNPIPREEACGCHTTSEVSM